MNNKIINVLLVDDDEDDYFLTQEYFSELIGWKFSITWCSNYKDALYHINHFKYDLYLFDYLLGENTGVDLVREACDGGCEEPIILLTGRGDTSIAVEALRLGAADYLIKGELNGEILERSIRYALERTAVLKALRHSEKRYRRIFEDSNDFLFISDLSGKILDCNTAATDLTGFSEKELLSMNILRLIGDAEFEKVWNNIEEVNIHDFEVTLSGKEYSDKKIGLFSASVDFEEETPFVQGRVYDITARKQSEKERLFSEKMAVTGRLVRMLAHEVRNPLTNVNLSAEQLEMELEDEDQKFYTQIIKRNCARINDLITQLLQPSISADIVLAEDSIHEVLEAAITSAYDRVTLKRVAVQNTFEAFDFIIPLDRISLEMAFLNMITNAIEAMEEDTGILHITTKNVSGTLQVIFSDNGSGIDAESLEKIFEPYFSKKDNGMGIGLATTLNVLHAHNARVDVQSVVGKGTVFTLTFTGRG